MACVWFPLWQVFESECMLCRARGKSCDTRHETRNGKTVSAKSRSKGRRNDDDGEIGGHPNNTSTQRWGGVNNTTDKQYSFCGEREGGGGQKFVNHENVIYGGSLALHLAAHDELLKFPLFGQKCIQAHSPHPSVRPEEGGNLNRFRGKSTNNRHSSFEGRNGGIDQIKSPNPINGLND